MKYNVGDRVRIKSIDWYNENKTTHGYVWVDNILFDSGQSLYCGCELTIRLVTDDSYYVIENDYYWTDEMIECKVEEENTLKTQSDNMETETHKGYCTTDVETTNESKKVAWFTFWDNDFADKVELDLSNRELIHEDGKWFVVKKKKEYPKSYEECMRILGFTTVYTPKVEPIFDYDDDIIALQKLKNCRNAYWKIAGEEMGLGKPWYPNWHDDEKKYTIEYYDGEIIKDVSLLENRILVFPTAEMRDAFYENFKELIEQCKELL